MLYKKNTEKKLSDELFQNPTCEYRATPFWAWNCKMTKEILTEQIPYLKELGFGGFHMHSRSGMANEYMSDEFLSLVDACVKKAKSEDMLAWLYDEDRWASGAAGGYVTKIKKYRIRPLLFSKKKIADCTMDLEDAIENDKCFFLTSFDVKLNENGGLLEYHTVGFDETASNQWFAYLKPTQTSSWFNNQTYIDAMNPEAVDKFIAETHEKYKKKVGNEFNKTVPAIFTDEPNFGGKQCFDFATDEKDCTFPWTLNLDDTFAADHGYKISEKIPELFWDWADGSISQARYFYHDHITDRFVSAFTDKIGKWCKENGISLTGHVLNEPTLDSQSHCVGETMRTYRGFEIPGIDMLCNSVELSTAKQCQSAVHQYGKEGMLSELYGVTNWDFDFRGHKFQGDWQAALGVTVRVPHLSWVSMEGNAKRDYPATFNYQTPWYKEYKYVENHFARVNTALTRGKPVVKVGVIHPIESYWIHYGPKQSTAAICKRLDDQFQSLIEYLLFGTIDFDFISESLLPEQCGSIGKSLAVGEMNYDAVLVPDCITMRRTTLDILKKFRANGGKVIFAGDCPKYVDAICSDEVRSLYAESLCVGFNETEILDALSDERIISIKNANGTNTEKLIYNLRQDGDISWLFIAHGAKGDDSAVGTWLHQCRNCPDIFNPQKLVITVKGEFKPTIYNTIDGTKHPIAYRHQNGNTIMDYTIYINDSLLLKLEKSEEASFIPALEEEKQVKQTICIKKTECKRAEANVLLLDTCEYALDEEDYRPEEEILRLDNLCRARISLPPRGNEAQPWVIKEEKPTHSITMRFTIESEIEVQDALLAMERPENATAEWNGEKLSLEPVGYFTDKCIKTCKVSTIHKGMNQLVVRVPLGGRTNTEWMYLLGDFDVRVAGCEKIITEKAKKIGFGSITTQGMPFYGGNILYTSSFKTDTDGDAVITVSNYRGPLVRVSVDGKDLGVIAYAPYNVTCKGLSKGKHTLELKLFGNRVNSFGGVHNCNTDDVWYGPDYWYTTGDSWSYEYQLRNFGIMKAPIIEIY